MSAYERVQSARAKDRPTSAEYIKNIFTNFLEMHGDRYFGNDKAVMAGVAFLDNMPVTVIGIEKGSNVKERAVRNSGSAHPEGYRKALRQMKLAEKFNRPIICFIDTPGAYCGIGAEERGQGRAIAENIMEMTALTVPIISVLIGEGGSGGAMALAVADEVWMSETAVYSVISPEGCASILWKDASKVKEAAHHLKLTAEDLLSFGVIDKIIKTDGEPWDNIKQDLISAVRTYGALPKNDLIEGRYQRFRSL